MDTSFTWYEVVVDGPLADHLTTAFPDIRETSERDGATRLEPIRDNAELMAVLDYLVSRNIKLLLVERREKEGSPGLGLVGQPGPPRR